MTSVTSSESISHQFLCLVFHHFLPPLGLVSVITNPLRAWWMDGIQQQQLVFRLVSWVEMCLVRGQYGNTGSHGCYHEGKLWFFFPLHWHLRFQHSSLPLTGTADCTLTTELRAWRTHLVYWWVRPLRCPTNPLKLYCSNYKLVHWCVWGRDRFLQTQCNPGCVQKGLDVGGWVLYMCVSLWLRALMLPS